MWEVWGSYGDAKPGGIIKLRVMGSGCFEQEGWREVERKRSRHIANHQNHWHMGAVRRGLKSVSVTTRQPGGSGAGAHASDTLSMPKAVVVC